MNPNYQIIISAKDQTKAAFDAIAGSVTKLNGAIGLIGVAVGGIGAAGAVLGKLATDAANFSDEIGDLAQQLGTTTERLSALKFAAEIEGVFDELQGAMQRVAKASEEAADGSKSAQEAFAKLKIDPSQFKDTGELFEAIVEQLSQLPDGAQKTGIAMDLLGKSGAKLIPLINGGAEGLARAREEAEQFGLIVSQEAAEAAGELNDNLKRLELAGKGAAQELGNSLIPAMSDVVEEAVKGAKEGNILLGVLRGIIELGDVVIFGTEQEQRAERIAELTQFINFQQRQLKEISPSSNPEVLENIRKKIADAKTEVKELINLQSTLYDQLKGKGDSGSGGGAPATGGGKTEAEKAAEAAAKEAKNFVDNLKKQADQLNLTKTEQIAYEASLLKLTATQKLAVTASIEKIAVHEREKQALKELDDFQKLLNDSEDRALELQDAAQQEEDARLEEQIASYEDFKKKLTEQNEQLNLDLITNDKARAKAQLEIENARAIERIQGLMLEQDQVNELLDEQAKNYDLQLKKIENSTTGIGNLSKELGRQFTSAFEDAVLASGDFGDALDGLGKDLERLALQSITNPLFRGIQSFLEDNVSNFIPGIFANAKGGVYSGAGISQFSGSIVNSPTVFPFAKGIGLMGEAGPEAIMPLRRTADGVLGIKAQGMGANVTVNIVGAPSTPKINQTTDDNGNTNIDVMFEKVESFLGSRVAKGQGALAEVLGSNFGLSRGYGAQG